jgi:hypothetical protein
MQTGNQSEANVQDIVKKTQPGRVWFLFSHKNDRIGMDPELEFINSVDQAGRILDRYKASGASVYLVEIIQ